MRRSDKVGLTVGALVLGAGLAAAIVADLGRDREQEEAPPAAVETPREQNDAAADLVDQWYLSCVEGAEDNAEDIKACWDRYYGGEGLAITEPPEANR